MRTLIRVYDHTKTNRNLEAMASYLVCEETNPNQDYCLGETIFTLNDNVFIIPNSINCVEFAKELRYAIDGFLERTQRLGDEVTECRPSAITSTPNLTAPTLARLAGC